MTNGPGLSDFTMDNVSVTPDEEPKNENEVESKTGALRPTENSREAEEGMAEDTEDQLKKEPKETLENELGNDSSTKSKVVCEGESKELFKHVVSETSKVVPEETSNKGSGDNSDEDHERGDSKDEQKTKKAIVRVDQIFSRKEWKYIYVRTSRSSKKISGKYALVVRQVFNSREEYEETVVEIRGEALRDILATMIEGAESLRLNEKPALIEPRLLYHCAPKLRHWLEDEKTANMKDDSLIFDIKAALQLIEEDFSMEEASIKSLVTKGEITFETLWAIYPPNELAYTLDALSEPCVFRVVGHRIQKKLDGSVVFQISGRNIDSNGKSFGWAKIKFLEIPSFPGAKPIRDLIVFPLRFHDDSGPIRTELLCRGRRRLLLHKQGFYDYKGHALQEKELPNGDVYLEKFNSHGRVIVDHAVFAQINANSSLVPKIDHALFEGQLTDDQLITLPSMLYGFSLGDKVWGGFAVSRIGEIIWNHSIWDSLVLPGPQKQVIKALVKNHVTRSSNFDDFVQDKGKGLIGLFSGPPGVGKTLTAEAVAEIVERPLYVLSSGELGDEPHKIDETLKGILELTHTWNAVLLLDEADVFMTRRSGTDITHNAIVSIFLRQLEYYQGILILTTNRVEAIDDAFQSRIHFCYSYTELTPLSRKSIWLRFLEKAKASGLALDIPSGGIDELSHMNLNGRQIKNIMKISESIAIEEQQTLTAGGIKIVAETLQSFNSTSP
ncbi:P-loop containing nucleoside triphosphate hydrolase protein [Rhexocercosporidium sp. MPI-PUGE-AT-0058]|nr:P-loop containing nucleoside triphosphate hydrolase protein [Rhexocercosporidium sp. MPI-PUGE-AT-0058]